jgi:hypothetical protein
VSELAVLQAVRLKGRVSRDDLAATLGDDPSDVIERLVGSGLLLDGPTLRLSPEGRKRLAGLLAAERSSVDPAALEAAYDEFRSVNAEFKALVTDWQLTGDAAVLARLDDVHRRVTPIVAAVAAQLPRLDRYSAKLQTALDRVRAGETIWLARPLIDSYHTVWFELHEELILAAGRTRESDDA